MKRPNRHQAYRRLSTDVEDADLMDAITRLHRRNRWKSRSRDEWEADLWAGYDDEPLPGGPPPPPLDDDDYFLNR